MSTVRSAEGVVAFRTTILLANRNRLVVSVDGAKTPATRERRIARAMDELRGART
jgi:hypothetical protein